MNESFFEVGITAGEVAVRLMRSPLLSIVGFQRSGKSTLAEMLDEDLHREGYSTFMQNASSWIRYKRASLPTNHHTPASVDPEIVHAMEQLEQRNDKPCWIVDDAEVMLAYATESILRNLGARLEDGRFSLVMIRNLFILEGEGWYQRRLAMISSQIEALLMRPLEKRYAEEVATKLFQGPARTAQGRWLASMSGGIPGLMSDLYPYSPEWPPADPTPKLRSLASRKRRELDLERPIRRMLATALARQVLPPRAFLSDQAKRDLGALALAGMVPVHYPVGERTFNGEFWDLVAELDNIREPIPPIYIDVGISLEIMLRKAALSETLAQECGVASRDETALGYAFAASLYCADIFPILVRPLKEVFCQILGTLGLLHLLKRNGITSPPTASPNDLANDLFRLAAS